MPRLNGPFVPDIMAEYVDRHNGRNGKTSRPEGNPAGRIGSIP